MQVNAILIYKLSKLIIIKIAYKAFITKVYLTIN